MDSSLFISMCTGYKIVIFVVFLKGDVEEEGDVSIPSVTPCFFLLFDPIFS